MTKITKKTIKTKKMKNFTTPLDEFYLKLFYLKIICES